MEGYKGRGYVNRGGRFRHDAPYNASDRGPLRSSRGRGYYASSRGRFETRYDGGYTSHQTGDHESRKRNRSESGSGGYHSHGRPNQDGTHYSDQRTSKSRIPPPPSPSWVDEGRHYERKRMKSEFDSYSEATGSRRHVSRQYSRSEYQERRGYREEDPKDGSHGTGRYYTSPSYDTYRGERRESRYSVSRNHFSPHRRGYAAESGYSRAPLPSHLRGVGPRLRGRGYGMERGRSSTRFLRSGRRVYSMPFNRFAREREGFYTRWPGFGAQSQMQRNLFLRRRALDNRRRMLFERSRRLRDSEDEEDWDDEDEDDAEVKEKRGKGDKDKTTGSGEAGSVEKTKSGRVQVTIQQDKEGRAVNNKDGVFRQRIKLLCPHCKYWAYTFTEYNYHLRTGRHIRALNSLSYRIKMALSKMLIKQRNMQRDLEKAKEEDGGELLEKSSYCSTCKLLYRDPKQNHQASEMHKLLKKFLHPYCLVCQTSFTSPMSYEKHTASLFHMKKKARAGKGKAEEDGGDNMQGDEEPPEFDEDNNTNDLMMVDSVGDVDEEQQTEDGEKDPKKAKETIKEITVKGEEGKEKTSTAITPAGEKFVKKLSVFYCSLCRRYLPRVHPLEHAAGTHSETKVHLRNRRQKEKEKLEAAKVDSQEKEGTEKEEQTSPKPTEEKEISCDKDEAVDGEKEDGKMKQDGENKETKAADAPEKTEADESELKEQKRMPSESDDKDGLDKKLWDDVDRDLGDLLKEVDPSSTGDGATVELDKNVDDDDEQGEQERWDRLKTSEKVAVTLETKPAEADEEVLTIKESGDA